MNPLTHAEVLRALGGRGSSRARKCIADLVAAEDPTYEDAPMRVLRKVKRHLADAHAAARKGALVVAVLKAEQPSVIVAWVEEVTEGELAISEKIALELYADCYLVLADWVTQWNRRQIRQVA